MKRLITGFFAFFSIIGLIVSLCCLFTLFITSNSDAIPPNIIPFLVFYFVILALSVFSSLIQSVIYIIYTIAFQKDFSTDKKIAWCLLLWFFGLITVPIYWKKFINNPQIKNKEI